MHFFKFHINDYSVQTRHLSNDEDLCYRRLLDLYYTEEAPIPLETEWVARRIQLATEVVKSVLSDFFTEMENGWINTRVEVEIAEYHAVCKKNRTNGKRGGRPSGSQRKPKGNPVGTQTKASRTLSVISNQESYTPIVPKGTDSELELSAESTDLPDPDLVSIQRARMLFRMRSSTPLDESQVRAWKKNRGAVCASSENDWLLLEWFYAQGTGKGDPGEYRRKDLAQLLNHWNGEIQRAADEAKNRGADFLQKRKAAEQAEGPAGWRKALVEIFDDTTEETAAAAVWGKLPQSVRDSITLRLEGGAA